MIFGDLVRFKNRSTSEIPNRRLRKRVDDPNPSSTENELWVADTDVFLVIGTYDRKLQDVSEEWTLLLTHVGLGWRLSGDLISTTQPSELFCHEALVNRNFEDTQRVSRRRRQLLYCRFRKKRTNETRSTTS